MPWNEGTIGAALARQTFKGHLVVVPNCTWTGYECDLLVVTNRLLLVDVEVKISRADLKADAKKDKWWHHRFTGYAPEERVERDGRLVGIRRDPIYDSTHRDWPLKVWKHYYAMPRAIWKPELMETLASTKSGVLLLGTERHPDQVSVELIRRPAANRDAKPVDAASVMNIARLASLRMWDAFRDIERMKDDRARTRALLSSADDTSIAKQ